jgi:hypothetical protein
MKVQDLLTELQETEHYKTFKSQNQEAFFSAAFIIFDLESQTEKIQMDFFLPNQNKMASFEHPYTEAKIHEDEIKDMKLQSTEIKIDIDDLEQKCQTTIKENESAIKPTKIIAILRDDQWNLTCMDNALGIIRIKLNAITGEQTEFNKGSLMDFMGIKKP